MPDIISTLTELAEQPAVDDLLVLTDVSDTTQAGTGTTKKIKPQYALGSQVNAQTGTTYTVLATDFRKLVSHANASPIAVTLPQASASFPAGWWYLTVNLGAGEATITPTTSTINGAATLALAQGEGAIIFSDGTNYTAAKFIANATSGAIADDSVTNAKLANMATQTIKGRTTAGTGDPEDLSATQATAILNAVVGDAGAGGTKGLVPAPAAGDAAAGKFLKADGTFAVPSGTGAEPGANSDITSMDGLTGALQYPTQVDLTEGAAPGTPAASKVSLYAKTDGLLYSKDDAGTETALGGTGGYAGVTTGGTGSLDMAQGTKTANEPFVDASVTWNSAGVTFDGITVNCIDTASAAASRLILLRTSGSTILSLTKSGALSLPNSGSTIAIAQNGSYGWSGGGTLTSGFSGASGSTIKFSATWASALGNYTAPSGSTNNPDFGSGNYLYRVTPNAAGSTLTGGRDVAQTTEMHELANVGSSMLTLANNNSSSSAGRRWITAHNLDMRIPPNQRAPYIYDGTTNNLRIGKFATVETLNVTTQFDKTDTTLADITELSIGVQASRTYNFRAVLFVDADATGGYKLAIGGTATATAIRYHIRAINDATGLFTITSRQTALAGSAGAATGTALMIEIEGTITVNAAGTLTAQFAQNAANGTSSVLVGSLFMVNNIS